MADEPNNDDRINRIDPRLLEILVCPRTKTSLLYDEARQELISRAASLAYPIRDGIPIMLEEEARQLDGEHRRALARRVWKGDGSGYGGAHVPVPANHGNGVISLQSK